MGWEEVELMEVAELSRDSIKSENITDGINYLGLDSIYSEGVCKPVVTISGKIKSNKFKFNQNHILYGKLRPYLRKIAIPKFAGICSTDIIPILPDISKIDQRFLYHFLRTDYMVKFATTKCSGANLPRISPKQISSFKIPLPPLPIQKKIAAILDAADDYRQKTKALIDKYDQLTQSIFLDMFGDPVRNEKGWEVKKMAEVCTKITDGTHHSPKPQLSGYPYVTAKHVKPFRLDFESKPTYVSNDAHDEIYKRCDPKFGDILYIKDGATTGRACLNTFKEPISLLSSLALLQLSDQINNYYLCHWLNHDGIKLKLINEFMSGAAIKRYTLKKIKLFKVMIPNLELQIQFASKVKAIEIQKEQANINIIKSEQLFQSLLQKAFKGELVS